MTDIAPITDVINDLLKSEKLKQQIDESLNRGSDIGKAVREAIITAIASYNNTLQVCFNEITLKSDGVLCADFEVLGEIPPLKSFLTYDGISAYDGNHHYHTKENS
ncbi:MAG: hypothetical protein AAF378_19020 [Cyanobacteria bacterium P01_A01_bin.84]